MGKNLIVILGNKSALKQILRKLYVPLEHSDFLEAVAMLGNKVSLILGVLLMTFLIGSSFTTVAANKSAPSIKTPEQEKALQENLAKSEADYKARKLGKEPAKAGSVVPRRTIQEQIALNKKKKFEEFVGNDKKFQQKMAHVKAQKPTAPAAKSVVQEAPKSDAPKAPAAEPVDKPKPSQVEETVLPEITLKLPPDIIARQ